MTALKSYPENELKVIDPNEQSNVSDYVKKSIEDFK